MTNTNEKFCVNDKFAWIVVRKRTGQVVPEAGIDFEIEAGKCPANILVNPIYKDEYENKRVCICCECSC
jgi:hypothetical protein